MSFLRDLRIAVRSLARVPALWITVALTLALGIGANAAIFSVVRAVLLRPLANRDEARLLYLRQSAPGIKEEHATFSVPEIDDLDKNLTTVSEMGSISAIPFTVVGLGTPREVPAGVVDGHYFEVMGLRPVLGRLLTPADDGPNAPGAIVLTYRFWRNSLKSHKRRASQIFERSRLACFRIVVLALQQLIFCKHSIPVIDELKRKVKGLSAQRNRLLLPLKDPAKTIHGVVVKTNRFSCFQ